jgi:hypothetical protein
VNGKPLKGNEIRFAQVATGLSPSDFPLGSLESRAIARRVLEHAERMAPQMPQADQDALILYRGVVLLNATMDPSYAELERTAAYVRGEELSTESAIPSNYFESVNSTPATLAFHLGFGRTPERGDLLRFRDVELIHSPGWYVKNVRDFSEAWTRQLTTLPCPLRVDDDNRVFCRLGKTARKENGGQEWQEVIEHLHRVERCWRSIEIEALGGDRIYIPDDPQQLPTEKEALEGVTFDGLKWRPATGRELQEVEIEPSGGLLGLLVEASSRIEEGA